MSLRICHADLLRAFASLPQSGCEYAASLCGFAPREPEPPVMEIRQPGKAPPVSQSTALDFPPERSAEDDGPPGRLRIIRPATIEFRDAADKAATHWLLKVGRIASEQWRVPRHPRPAPAKSDLMPWPRLWPFLHRCQSLRRDGPRVAVDPLVAALARLAPLNTVPYEPVWQWTRDSWILLDFRDALYPFHDDMQRLRDRWRAVFGADACRIFALADGYPPASVPPVGTPVLYVGDFGMLDNRHDADAAWDRGLLEAWVDYGRRLRRRKCRPCALLPCPRQRWDAAITSLWICATWSETAQPPSVERGWSPREDKPGRSAAALEQLSILAAPAMRINRSLLRALRRLLAPEFDDPAVEYDFFHAAVRDLDAVVLSGEAATSARPAFRALAPQIQQQIVDLLREHNADCAEIVRARETLVLEACGAPVPAEAVARAKELVQGACAALLAHLQADDREAILREGFANWQQCELESFTESTAEEIAVAWRLIQEVIGQAAGERPEPISDQDLLWLEQILKSGSLERTDWHLQRVGGNLRFESTPAEELPAAAIHYGGPAVRLPARSRRSEIRRKTLEGISKHDVDLARGYQPKISGDEDAIEVRTDLAVLRCEALPPPEWASRFGWDRFGLFADFEVEGVTFALRWIPPGEFEMGSPEEEPGRWEAEGPKHRVTIGRGFWLAATPVTQAQYAAVTGQRPSEFEHAGDRAPVEQVSWEDCREFCAKLKRKLAESDQEPGPELIFRLPSEAEWEYACRAGTSTALYTGPLTMLGECNGPELAPIAWYAGNSGVDYEGGADSSKWPEKQQDHRRAGTHPVGAKAPNAWGLHDMLGNVWEWCEDTWHDSYKSAPDDGSAWMDETVVGSHRVRRGGSWAALARDSRCAYRSVWPPGSRLVSLGFRFVLAASSNEDIRAFP